MGKRKRFDEGEEDSEAVELDASTSLATEQHLFQEPSLKRTKREETTRSRHNHSNGELLNGHPSCSSDTVRLNGSVQTAEEGDENTVIWLVRKPIAMPLEELHKIRFSRKPKYEVQQLSISSEQAESANLSQVECRLGRISQPMIRVAGDNRKKIDEKRVLRPEQHLRGIVWINEVVSPSETEMPSEEFDDDLFVGKPLEIASIRRKPEVDQKMLRERLKAFGVKPAATTAEEEVLELEPTEEVQPRKRHKRIK